ncbi:MAG: 2-oxoacid:acceptor oxidoreductase subunit alpha [Candidatus Thermoplasmatota archaeon]|jgi:2-oxoglutarate ferredoxin oxidoreductase subunit alpha|nr:2-oxoacid:acceptor oxidoreductase subunit alpha [Candidatus Thermoplasmatota archaeon]MDP7265054.1 2-oxoacid:acceptor oxidoreductase subunit alpha [Candidatus Thermoplasmatota archaeon]
MIEYLEGNDAVVRGAIDAGCRFFAGYPITPASSILHGMIRELPKVGGIAVQGEDEIASIGFCIGASMAGLKSMTATSGPGISLYSENIGLAIMGETPLVIVDVQRQGPATGSATMGAEGDIQFVRWGTSGGLPIVALAPTTVEECYSLTIRAFNIAERLRIPVFLMSNKELGQLRERTDLDALDKPEILDRRRVKGDTGEFVPHLFLQPGDVPLMSDIGGKRIVRYTTSMHYKDGFITKRPEEIGEMMEHFTSKIMNRRGELELVEKDFQEGAETLLVSYGIVARSAREAVAELRKIGKKISHLVIVSIWPVPEIALTESLIGCKRVIVPEMNLGQYVLEIERIARKTDPGIEVVSVSKMDTTLLSPREIIDRGV